MADAPPPPRHAAPRAAYETIVPYYAELCALSELRKKPGFGVPIRSGIGGHSLLYLNGVRINRRSGYPELELCPPDADPGRHGASISVNSHYRNANWVAIEGRDFVFRGALAPGEPLTRDAYMHTQERARAAGLLDGIAFHTRFFADKPAGMSDEAFKYEISVATDYAAQFGRDCTCARLPLDAARMQRIVDFLNGLNTPYRAGTLDYRWRLFTDNCVHVAHDALAEAGFWAPWPRGRSALRAAFGFPVPKNAVVNLALRANDLPVADPQALFDHPGARRALMQTGSLPTGPGALVSTAPAIGVNDVYDVRKLRLIFYDNPFWGPYRGWFRQITTEARYTDLDANLMHFDQLYRRAADDLAAPRRASALQGRFRAQYARHIAAEREKLARWRARSTT